MNGQYLQKQHFLGAFFANDSLVAAKDKMRLLGTTAGDGVFVLGFPMNLAGKERNFVIVRQGIIARISDMFANASPDYLVDALMFPR
jgi:hypothetical protein